MLDEDGLFEDLSPVCAGLGLTLVDCRLQMSRNGANCQIIIFKKDGVSTGDCALAHRTIRPRLEIVMNTQDINLEVSSPGTDRKIRLSREYPLFIGRGFNAALRSGASISGVLSSADEENLTIKTKNGDQVVPLSDIVKAKLDYTQEVK